MLEIIHILQHLRRAWSQTEEDKRQFLNLYQFLSKNCSDKENFEQNSIETIQLLEQGTLSGMQAQRWLAYAGNILASYIAVELYGDKQLVSSEEIDSVITFFEEEPCSMEVKALGIYACAYTMDATDPMRCYELVQQAFQIYPNLASLMNVEYTYQPDGNEANYTTRCPMCGGEDARAYFCSPQVLKLNKRRDFPPAKLWMKCNCCGNHYTYEFPLQQVGTINGHYTVPREGATLKNRFALSIYNEIFQRLTTYTSGRDYLEIGIGNGEMLAVAQEFGFHTKAVEICKEDCERVSAALNTEIVWADIVQYETQEQYDVIVMGDVLEHVTNPLEVLQKVKKLLKQDGVLWISTPNYNCAYARMEKFTHCMWHELNHYTYISYEGLLPVLTQLGLEVVNYSISQRYIGSMELCVKNTIGLSEEKITQL